MKPISLDGSWWLNRAKPSSRDIYVYIYIYICMYIYIYLHTRTYIYIYPCYIHLTRAAHILPIIPHLPASVAGLRPPLWRSVQRCACWRSSCAGGLVVGGQGWNSQKVTWEWKVPLSERKIIRSHYGRLIFIYFHEFIHFQVGFLKSPSQIDQWAGWREVT